MKSPYADLAKRAYWRTGVAERNMLDIGDIYRKKFSILPTDKIATAGSCFAQHIASRLRQNGYQVLDAEPGPAELDDETARGFGFRLYSARYGNVYTLRQMRQLVQECLGQRTPRDMVWTKNGRFYDALRPAVEPEGLPSAEAVHRHRHQHLAKVKWLLQQTSLFIFTMGLTEAWEHVDDGTVYPTAPGTIAGTHDQAQYRFKNLDYVENLEDFMTLRQMLRGFNSQMRFIVTVSPVPLTATAGDEHVLPATVYSKSVLRALAGHLAQSYGDIDYFPSYDLVASAPARGIFYENNLRNVAPAGVDVVMRSFFAQHGTTTQAGQSAASAPQPAAATAPRMTVKEAAAARAFCEEELLEAFAK